MKLCPDVHDTQRMNPTDIGDPKRPQDLNDIIRNLPFSLKVKKHIYILEKFTINEATTLQNKETELCHFRHVQQRMALMLMLKLSDPSAPTQNRLLFPQTCQLCWRIYPLCSQLSLQVLIYFCHDASDSGVEYYIHSIENASIKPAFHLSLLRNRSWSICFGKPNTLFFLLAVYKHVRSMYSEQNLLLFL